MKLLILEDDPTMLETLKARLPWAEMGFDRILTAASIPEGKRLLSEEGADFLLLDVEVIRGTGIELLQWARAHGYDAECVFLTNHADFDYAKEAVRLGSVDYVLKTEPLSAVERAVRRSLSKRHPDILFDADKERREAVYDAPDTLKEQTARWEQLLRDDQRTQLLGDVRAYLTEREKQGDNHSGTRMVLQAPIGLGAAQPKSCQPHVRAHCLE